MARNYQTPGVYVEELSVLGSSIAQVPTAIPAFIGYTEKATNIIENDLSKKPLLIRSLREYHKYFGAAPTPRVEKVELDSNNTPTATSYVEFYLYYSLRLFFDNGGGECYIISVGDYANTTPSVVDFYAGDDTGGIEKAKDIDEITLLVFPDAMKLTDDELTTVQQQALAQCARLGDRFAILDIPKDSDSTDDAGKGAHRFRNYIGTNNLNYGAAYTPWLQTNYTRVFSLRALQDRSGSSVTSKIKRSDDTEVDISTLSVDPDFRSCLANLNSAMDLYDKFAKLNESTWSMSFKNSVNTFKAKDGQTSENFAAIINEIIKIYKEINDQLPNFLTLTDPSDPYPSDPDPASALKPIISPSFKKLLAYIKQANKATSDSAEAGLGENSITTDTGTIITTLGIEADKIEPNKSLFAGHPTSDADKVAEATNAALPKIQALFDETIAVLQSIRTSLQVSESSLNNKLASTSTVYRTIIDSVNQTPITLPPSGAIAGVYCSVDSNYGVWKAPANVSLNSVIGLSKKISFSDQESLNIDADAGKSINAIRSFPGKGILAWGARTLEGNSKDWRYISVKRLFIMVEESVKKSIEQVVFEPNDANTWIKVKASIESFLTNLWRNGALTGAKANQAFTVKVGLTDGTMDDEDIENGIMRVAVALAPVRPAEFIVLQFKQQMQQG